MAASQLTMEGRERVRRHFGRGGADRPPLIIFGTALAARLEQVEPDLLWHDANLLARTLLGFNSLFGLDAIVLDPPAAVLRSDQLATVSDAIGRLRTIAGDTVALVIALPGPLTQRGAGLDHRDATLDDLGDELVHTARELGSAHADVLAVVERTAVSSAGVESLEEALTPVWNAARYYAAASLLLATEGVPELGATGADAVAIWTGTSPRELAAHGSRRVGVPVEPGETELPELADGDFYISRGELPATTDIESLHRLIGVVNR